MVDSDAWEKGTWKGKEFSFKKATRKQYNDTYDRHPQPTVPDPDCPGYVIAFDFDKQQYGWVSEKEMAAVAPYGSEPATPRRTFILATAWKGSMGQGFISAEDVVAIYPHATVKDACLVRVKGSDATHMVACAPEEVLRIAGGRLVEFAFKNDGASIS